jgi:TatA/E family protein of Tat protein translocase
MAYFPSVAFLTGSVGSGEWIVLFVVILIVVGPKRMPDVARKIGRMMEMFRRAADEFKDQLMTMDQETPKPSPAEKPAVTSGDVDGVPSVGTTDGSSAAPYEDAYSNLSDYPGNEDQVENWPSEATPDAPGPAEPSPVPEPEKPSEGGA